MEYGDFLTRVIDEGIAAAKADYTRVDQAENLRGSIDGFVLCREQTPDQLRNLLIVVEQDAQRRKLERASDYWYWRCRASEVEWVCKVVSAVLVSHGAAPIAPHLYTANGALKAAEIILGVRSA